MTGNIRGFHALVLAMFLVATLSTAQVALIDGDTTPPGKVSDIGLARVGVTSINATWTAAEDDTAVTSYNIYISKTHFTAKSGATATNTGSDRTDGEVTELEQNTEYFYTVSALDEEGNEGELVFPVQSFVTRVPNFVFSPATKLVINEAERSGSFKVGLTDSPPFGQKVKINLTLISNDEFGAITPSLEAEFVEVIRGDSARVWADVKFTIPDDEKGFGDRTYLVRHSIDTSIEDRDERFDNLAPRDYKLIVQDDEVEPAIDLADETGIKVDEGKTANTFQVKLSRKPTDDVFVHVVSENPTRLALTTPHFLQFGIHDWDTYQNVTLKATNNGRVDGDQSIGVTVQVVDGESAAEYADRADGRQVNILVIDDELDADRDGILDSDDSDPNDRFNDDWRPGRFAHELSAEEDEITFTWTAKLDDRINRFVIWEFSEPTEVFAIDTTADQVEYTATVPFDGTVHKYSLQAVLSAHTGDYDSEVAVRLGQMVFTQEYYDATCPGSAKDVDGDDVCDAFEIAAGTDRFSEDTDNDGRTDHQELFKDNTDPTDADSHRTLVPAILSNPWILVAIVLILISVILVVIVSVRKRDG